MTLPETLRRFSIPQSLCWNTADVLDEVALLLQELHDAYVDRESRLGEVNGSLFQDRVDALLTKLKQPVSFQGVHQ